MKKETIGSRKLLQTAVEKYPFLLKEALVKSGAVKESEDIIWTSPLKTEAYREYRDPVWLKKLGLKPPLKKSLDTFWPSRGPVWDATAMSDTNKAISVEAKAHIPEAASPASCASPESMKLIAASLLEARKFYAPKSTANWSGTFYQYANRLAHHYYLKYLNDVPSILIFMNFMNAKDVDGPASEREWEGAVRLLHTVLGLPKSLERHGVFHVYVDALKMNTVL
jgi:hypothetical protein